MLVWAAHLAINDTMASTELLSLHMHRSMHRLAMLIFV